MTREAEVLNRIEELIDSYYEEEIFQGAEELNALLCEAIHGGYKFFVPVTTSVEVDGIKNSEDIEKINKEFVGKEITIKCATVDLQGGGKALMAFTSNEKREKAECSQVMETSIELLINSVMTDKNTDIKGISFNPFANDIFVELNHLGNILLKYTPKSEKLDLKFIVADTPQRKLGKGINLCSKLVEFCEKSEDIPRVAKKYGELLKELGNLSISGMSVRVMHITGDKENNKKLVEAIVKQIAEAYYFNPPFSMDIILEFETETDVKIAKAVWCDMKKACKKGFEKDCKNENSMVNDAVQLGVTIFKDADRYVQNRDMLYEIINMAKLALEVSDNPYIVSALILSLAVESGKYTVEEIAENFGEKVAYLIGRQNICPNEGCYKHIRRTIVNTESGERDFKVFMMIKTLYKLRRLKAKWNKVGLQLLEEINLPTEFISYYFSNIEDAFYKLQDTMKYAQYYWEAVNLYKDLFVGFFLDFDGGSIYQSSLHGETYKFDIATCSWDVFEGSIPEDAEFVERWRAENIIDSYIEEKNKQ